MASQVQFDSCGMEKIWCLAQCHPSDISGFKDWIEDKVFRIPVRLRIGAPLVQLHVCCHCGEQVDVKGTHGLSCCRSQDHYPRHASVKVVVKRSLNIARIPFRHKPNGLLQSDGKRPDGIVWSHESVAIH